MAKYNQYARFMRNTRFMRFRPKPETSLQDRPQQAPQEPPRHTNAYNRYLNGRGH